MNKDFAKLILACAARADELWHEVERPHRGLNIHTATRELCLKVCEARMIEILLIAAWNDAIDWANVFLLEEQEPVEQDNAEVSRREFILMNGAED